MLHFVLNFLRKVKTFFNYAETTFNILYRKASLKLNSWKTMQSLPNINLNEKSLE